MLATLVVLLLVVLGVPETLVFPFEKDVLSVQVIYGVFERSFVLESSCDTLSSCLLNYLCKKGPNTSRIAC